MLSTQYRLKLQEICERISRHEEVSLEDMMWIERLSKVNTTAATMIRQARRRAMNPDMTEDSLDGFLNQLDLGEPDPMNHKTSFSSPDDIAEWFSSKDGEDDRLRRD